MAVIEGKDVSLRRHDNPASCMHRSARIIAQFFLLAFLIGGIVWLGVSRLSLANIPQTHSNTISVVASFYPIAEFARNVGGDLVSVSTVTPAGAEPHDYEPTSQQIAEAYDAKVFLYNGGGVDAWAERISSDIAAHGVTVGEMSQSVNTVPPETDDRGEAESTSYDPHFWLDPVLAEKEVDAIRDAFSLADPEHADVYRANAAAYNIKLAALDQDFKNGLKECSTRTIITSHAAFAYLAREYNLNIIAISGVSPEEEPSARRIAEIADLARQKDIQYIYFETLISPKLSQTIAHEIGAQTLVFNPLEGLTDEGIAEGKSYLTVMDENLKNLEIGMACRD